LALVVVLVPMSGVALTTEGCNEVLGLGNLSSAMPDAATPHEDAAADDARARFDAREAATLRDSSVSHDTAAPVDVRAPLDSVDARTLVDAADARVVGDAGHDAGDAGSGACSMSPECHAPGILLGGVCVYAVTPGALCANSGGICDPDGGCVLRD